jgi:hypothetical protein
MERCGVDELDSGQAQVESCCEHGNEPARSV